MKTTAGVLTLLLCVGAVVWSFPLIVRRNINPAPATGIIGSCAMILALLAYQAIPNRTLIENVTLYGGALQITVTTAVLFWVLWRCGQMRVAFDWAQKICLLVMVITVLWWLQNKDHACVTFWVAQTLLVVAYIATAVRAIQRKTAFDSICYWAFIFTATVVGAIPAIMMQSQYGIANSIRGITSSGFTLLLLMIYDRRSGSRRLSSEVSIVADFYRSLSKSAIKSGPA